MAACAASPLERMAPVANTKIRGVLCPLLRRRAAKKVEALLEEQKGWFPTLDLYNAVLELQDELRGKPVPAGYDLTFWAKKAGNCSALSKALFVAEARKIILARIGGGPMPGEADCAGVEKDWLRFYERSISEMTEKEMDDAFDSFQDERYYFRKSCRRGEMDDAGRRENLRMELWGVAARHENTMRIYQRQRRESAAKRICHAIYGRYLRNLRKQAVRFMGTRLSDSQLAAEEIHTTSVLLAGESPYALVDAVYTLAARKIMKERDLPRATSTEGLVYLCIQAPNGVLEGPMWEHDAMWYATQTNEATLTLDLRKGHRELRGTTGLCYEEAKRFFFYYFWDQAHEWFYEEQARTVDLVAPVSVWRDIRGTMHGILGRDVALRLAVETRGRGLGICVNLCSGQMSCAAELPLAEAQQLFFPRKQELGDEETPAYWVEEQKGAAPQEDPAGCWGCREDQPNQLAHMEPGGCLYQDYEDY